VQHQKVSSSAAGSTPPNNPEGNMSDESLDLNEIRRRLRVQQVGGADSVYDPICVTRDGKITEKSKAGASASVVPQEIFAGPTAPSKTRI
jgi:hypothetical protein